MPDMIVESTVSDAQSRAAKVKGLRADLRFFARKALADVGINVDASENPFGIPFGPKKDEVPPIFWAMKNWDIVLSTLALWPT